MLKHGEANPLNIHGLRQLSHCPPHFSQVVFELYTTEKNLTDWLYENLEGRFYAGQIDVAKQRQQCIAFELPAEASYFSLFLPQLNQNPW